MSVPLSHRYAGLVLALQPSYTSVDGASSPEHDETMLPYNICVFFGSVRIDHEPPHGNSHNALATHLARRHLTNGDKYDIAWTSPSTNEWLCCKLVVTNEDVGNGLVKVCLALEIAETRVISARCDGRRPTENTAVGWKKIAQDTLRGLSIQAHESLIQFAARENSFGGDLSGLYVR